MHKDDLAQAIMNGMDAVGDTIVNPRCDECNTHLSTPAPHEIGLPRLCAVCSTVNAREHHRYVRDYISQERPRGRTIHVVKLPDGMRKR